MDEPAEAVVIPHAQLPPQTLRAVIESFVLREGTEYGAREFTLEEKVAHVVEQLERGVAQVIFEPQSQSVGIVMVAPSTRRTQRP